MRRNMGGDTQARVYSWARSVAGARAIAAGMRGALWSMWEFEADLVTTVDAEMFPRTEDEP